MAICKYTQNTHITSRVPCGLMSSSATKSRSAKSAGCWCCCPRPGTPACSKAERRMGRKGLATVGLGAAGADDAPGASLYMSWRMEKATSRCVFVFW